MALAFGAVSRLISAPLAVGCHLSTAGSCLEPARLHGLRIHCDFGVCFPVQVADFKGLATDSYFACFATRLVQAQVLHQPRLGPEMARRNTKLCGAEEMYTVLHRAEAKDWPSAAAARQRAWHRSWTMAICPASSSGRRIVKTSSTWRTRLTVSRPHRQKGLAGGLCPPAAANTGIA